MVVVTGNWRIWAAGMLVSLLIFGVLYVGVIKPNSDAANQALKTGMQQTQQALQQGQQAASKSAAQGSAVAGQAQQVLGNAAKLTACLAAAGTDVTKVQACQAKYGH
jgi:flagellar biosynthesis/type III secretory pathway M-ring protein FliF/YscJ